MSTEKRSLLQIVKPQTSAQKVTRTTVDTILVTPDLLRAWEIPPFQRPLRVNEKVRQLADTIKDDGGVIPGVITIGVIGKQKYLLDGQHRREAFFLSECQEGYVDVRVHHFSDMADMGEEFVNLNSQLVKMRPDDILRGLEGSNEGLQYIRKECSIVGYDMIRRGDRSPVLSMSALLRVWYGSDTEVPASVSAGVTSLAKKLTLDEAHTLVKFLRHAQEAWGRDSEYYRLWGALNFTICAWIYRRMVLSNWSPRTVKLTHEQYKKCLMSVSADSGYLDWLVGRQLGERDRSPCYSRVRAIFVKRLEQETGKKYLMPAPAWASHSGGRR